MAARSPPKKDATGLEQFIENILRLLGGGGSVMGGMLAMLSGGKSFLRGLEEFVGNFNASQKGERTKPEESSEDDETGEEEDDDREGEEDGE